MNIVFYRSVCYLCCATVSACYGLDFNNVVNPEKHKARHFRHIAIYLMVTVFNISKNKTAVAFNMDASSIGYACNQIEIGRDDAGFDKMLDFLSNSLSFLSSSENFGRFPIGMKWPTAAWFTP